MAQKLKMAQIARNGYTTQKMTIQKIRQNLKSMEYSVQPGTETNN